MSTLDIIVALLGGMRVAGLELLLGTLMFVTVRAFCHGRGRYRSSALATALLRIAHISAAFAWIIGMAWLMVESVVRRR